MVTHGTNQEIAERMVASPVGTLRLQANSQGIVGLSFAGSAKPCLHGYRMHNEAHRWLNKLEQQLSEYFQGTLHYFDLPLVPAGTEFQLQVWQSLCTIAYGETSSYRELAESVQRPKGFQAVGQANSRNPIAIVIPCHRVIQQDGSLGGYAGGSERKKWLLIHERKHHEKTEHEKPAAKLNFPTAAHLKRVR